MDALLRRYIVSAYNQLNLLDAGTKKVDLTRDMKTNLLAAHLIELPPGARSSLPHAESEEEEFFFVIRGSPIVWLDGHSYQLREGHAVAFPAGEGLCHTVINDSQESVLLLSLGEKTKATNRWIFPLNPEEHLKQDVPAWKGWISRHIGPHPGTANSNIETLDPSGHGRIVFAPEITPFPQFSYNGSTETFGVCRHVNNSIGLDVMGFGYETLAPSKRSSWPHAHSKEEEFVFILKGNPIVWLNGYTQTLKPGDFAYFEPGSGIAHTLLNPTQEKVEYLVWGLTVTACENDLLYYPFHPERNKECLEKEMFWEDFKVSPLGPHPGHI